MDEEVLDDSGRKWIQFPMVSVFYGKAKCSHLIAVQNVGCSLKLPKPVRARLSLLQFVVYIISTSHEYSLQFYKILWQDHVYSLLCLY